MSRGYVLLLCCLTACASWCGEPGHVAELERQTGQVQRDLSAQREAWRPAQVGDSFAMGDGLKTGPRSTAQLKLIPEGEALVEPGTIMRFLDRLPGNGKERISLEEGSVELEATELDLDVHTPRAVAHLSRGGRVRISAGEATGVRFDVLVGRVQIDREGGTETATPEAPVVIGPPAPAAESAESPQETPKNPTLESDQPSVDSKPKRAEVALAPGESATIHAASVPVDVRVELPTCAGTRVLEINGPARQRVSTERDTDSVLTRLGAGSHRLRVRCDGQAISERTLRVQRDPATLELPKSAQRVQVEADGRRYTVHYQNVLPAVSFAWPEARAGGQYTLFIRRGTRQQRFTSERPLKELRSGELSEGECAFWFEGPAGARSPEGTLRIVFDNTARSAYLAHPSEGAPRTGDAIEVAGGALLRSEVSVDGVKLPLDAQGRFRGSVPVPAESGALAVRVSHPVTGVHYYLRRVR